MATVGVGQVDVGYGLEGSGDPVVLVHGTTSSRLSRQLQAPALAATYQLITPEFPGSGETVDHDPSRPLTVDELAAQAIAVADAVGADRFHVAGWSLGAVVAAAIAAAVPARVRSAVLVNGWVTTDARMRFTFDFWNRLIAADPELFARYAFADGLTAGAHAMFTNEGVEALVPATATGLAPGSNRQIDLDRVVDIADRIGLITAPTLVIGGIEDRWVDIVHSRQLAAEIAHARLVELPCGHLVPTEQAEALTSLMLDHFAAH